MWLPNYLLLPVLRVFFFHLCGLSSLTYSILFEFHSHLGKNTGDRSDCHHCLDEDRGSKRSQGRGWVVRLGPESEDLTFVTVQADWGHSVSTCVYQRVPECGCPGLSTAGGEPKGLERRRRNGKRTNRWEALVSYAKVWFRRISPRCPRIKTLNEQL